MIDITHKFTTERTALASAVVSVSKQQTIDAIVQKTVPKGDVLEMAKTAGLFAVKKTSDVIPDCHPLPIEYTHIEYKIEGLDIHIYITVKTIYKTGVEVEAMHGASVIALTMYDMLKPIDKHIEIKNIHLVDKKGGKSDLKEQFDTPLKAAIILCSDAIYHGKKKDNIGKIIENKLEASHVQTIKYDIIPDHAALVKDEIHESLNKKVDLVIVAGGTGIGHKDHSSQVIEDIIEKRVPGIEEAIRNYGQQRTPYAMFSRSVVGTVGKAIVMAIPGSTNGVKESVNAIFPTVLHAFKSLKR